MGLGLKFVFNGDFWGQYNPIYDRLLINLEAFEDYKSEIEIITRLLFVLEHEYIHVAQSRVSELTHKNNSSERETYYLIGNDGDTWFNECYNIPIDKKWWND